MPPCLASLSLDRRFIAWSLAWSAVALAAFGLVSAIIPNPVFGRQVPPEPFAVWVWLASAPLMGIVGATYTSPARASTTAIALPLGATKPPEERSATTLGTIGSLGTFLAIGCPVCNKIALILLGASGALTVYAPLQPMIGAASLALLVGTIAGASGFVHAAGPAPSDRAGTGARARHALHEGSIAAPSAVVEHRSRHRRRCRRATGTAKPGG